MRKRVLVVEDEPDVARLLDFHLRGAGLEVIVADTAAAALAQARADEPTVVLLDVMLPDGDGFAVCKALRAEPATAGVGVVMLTARAEADDRITGLEVGADDYVVKPLMVREVVLRGDRAGEPAGRARDAGALAQPLTLGPLHVDPIDHAVTRAGAPLALRLVEYKLLEDAGGGAGRGVLARGVPRRGLGHPRQRQHPHRRRPRRAGCARASATPPTGSRPSTASATAPRRSDGVALRTRLLLAFATIVLVETAATLVLLDRTLERGLVDDTDDRLRHQALGVIKRLDRADHPDRLAPWLGGVVNARVTIIDGAGVAVADSERLSDLGHAIGDAPEIRGARAGGSGARDPHAARPTTSRRTWWRCAPTTTWRSGRKCR